MEIEWICGSWYASINLKDTFEMINPEKQILFFSDNKVLFWLLIPSKIKLFL